MRWKDKLQTEKDKGRTRSEGMGRGRYSKKRGATRAKCAGRGFECKMDGLGSIQGKYKDLHLASPG